DFDTQEDVGEGDVKAGDADALADAGPLPDVEAVDLPNALGFGGHDLLPWPSDQYLRTVDDRHEVAVDPSLLPTGFSVSLIAGSGASRVTPVVTWLPGGIDPATLPDPNDWGATLDAESSVRVIVLQDDAEPEPWPVLAEIDMTTRTPTEATLIIRPHRPFPAASQVVVGLRTSLRTYACALTDPPEGAECKNHDPSLALQRILDGTPDGRAEASWMGRSRDALTTALPWLTPDPTDLAQAWTFTIREKDEVVEPMLKMQRIAADADASSFTLEPVVYEDARALIYGTVDVPWFLDERDRLVLDENGDPQVQEVRATPFLVTIPSTVTETRPVVLFGHGFFSAIEESTWGNLFNGLARWEMAAVTTRFHGFAEVDFVKAANAIGGRTLEGMVGIIDLQRQSQANFTVVHNMIRLHLAGSLTVDFGDGEFSPLDASNIPYMGISNGGTQGLVMMSTSPVLTRGALVVPGGGWAHMLQRAAQWSTLGPIFANRFNDDAELQLAMAMTQHIFDPVDSLNFVEHLVADRLPGLPENPEILLVEVVNDAQVANMVTRWVAGTAKVPQIVPGVAEVWNIPTVDASAPDGAPGGVGYEIYDLGVPDNPPGNIAATENGVHDQVRLLDAYREQMGIFLEDGRVVRTCDGVCDPE
ncbi:MAG: hypothetical protein ACNA8W_16165, partial [Bradymonadaceae bacterium]